MGTTSGIAGILSFVCVVLMMVGFLRFIYLTRIGLFADEEGEGGSGNDHTSEEFRRQEADLEAGIGRRRQRGLREEEEEQEELEGLFWDVELVFPARRQNSRQRWRNTAHGTPEGVSAGGGRRPFRLSEPLFRRDVPTGTAPPRPAGIIPGGFVEGGNFGEQRGGQGAGALDPLTRESFIHFVAKAGDGFAPPTVGEAAAAVAAAFTTTGPSARVATSLEEHGASRPCDSVAQGQERERLSPAQAEARSGSREEREEGQEEETWGGEGRHDTSATAAVAGGRASSGGRALGLESDTSDVDGGSSDGGRGVEHEGMQMEVGSMGAASLAAGANAALAASMDVNVDVDARRPGPAGEVLGDTVTRATASGGAADAHAGGVAPETPGRAGVRAQSEGKVEGSAGDAVAFASGSDRRPGSSRLSFNGSREGKKLPAYPRLRRWGSSITCPVCLDVFQEQDVITLVTCGHAFHWKCVEPWLERSARCPCCRQDLNALTANLLKSTEQWTVGPYHPHLGGVSRSSSSGGSNRNSGGWQHQHQQQEHGRPPDQSGALPPPPPPPPPPPATPPPAEAPVFLDRHGHAVARIRSSPGITG